MDQTPYNSPEFHIDLERPRLTQNNSHTQFPEIISRTTNNLVRLTRQKNNFLKFEINIILMFIISTGMMTISVVILLKTGQLSCQDVNPAWMLLTSVLSGFFGMVTGKKSIPDNSSN